MSYLDELSARLGVPYRPAALPEGCRGLLVDGAVVLAEDLTPERAHWAYCHEVAHLRLGHAADLPADPSEEQRQEAETNALAAELLLPQDQFRPQTHLSLTELKALFPFASHEVLARRRLTFRPGLLTIFDNDKQTSRIAPESWNVPTQLFPLESKARKRCLKTKAEVLLEDGGRKVEATYIDEGRGVVRVIVFLEGEETEGVHL
jgi:hypothetical protein